MPRKKVVKTKAEEPPVVTTEQVVEAVETKPATRLPVGVVEVLSTLPKPGFKHCKMADGTTKHIPEDQF